MRDTRHRRRHVAGLVAAIILVSMTAAAALVGTGEKDAPIRTLAEQLGPTTGFAFTIAAGGDLDGSLETCGCPKRPMGGYAWRMGYTAELAKATSGRVPIVQVDAGRAFSDDLTESGMAVDVRLKNEWMLRSFERMKIAAINVAHADLVYLGPLMDRKVYRSKARSFPALGALTSANVVPSTAARQPFKPYHVQEVRSPELGRRAVRVGFVGVSEPPPPSVAKRTEFDASGYTIADPMAVLARVLPEVRAKSDVVVVLAYVDREVAKQIAGMSGGPDYVIAAHQYPLFNKTDRIGAATIAYIATETKWLSELRFAAADTGAPTRVKLVLHRDVPLDAATPLDAKADELVTTARNEFTAAQEAALAAELAGPSASALEARRAALAESSAFAGSEACATCHQHQYEVWKMSEHSHAFQTLVDKKRHLDAACTACHSVRQGEPGGFQNTRLTPRLENVQCESCHGPGKGHVAAPAEEGYGAVKVPGTCVKCHNLENDPDFNFPTYWPKIVHDEPELTEEGP